MQQKVLLMHVPNKARVSRPIINWQLNNSGRSIMEALITGIRLSTYGPGRLRLAAFAGNT